MITEKQLRLALLRVAQDIVLRGNKVSRESGGNSWNKVLLVAISQLIEDEYNNSFEYRNLTTPTGDDRHAEPPAPAPENPDDGSGES